MLHSPICWLYRYKQHIFRGIGLSPKPYPKLKANILRNFTCGSTQYQVLYMAKHYPSHGWQRSLKVRNHSFPFDIGHNRSSETNDFSVVVKFTFIIEKWCCNDHGILGSL